MTNWQIVLIELRKAYPETVSYLHLLNATKIYDDMWGMKSLAVHVATAREKLKPNERINNVKRVGYKLELVE